MKNKKVFVVLVLIFVVVLVGAMLLYKRLGESIAPDQLAAQEQESEPEAEKQEHEPAAEESKKGSPAVDFTVYDADGTQVQLLDYVGKPMVLNFWASWCGPCKMEMPDFQEKYEELGEDIQFLMVNMTDGSRETKEKAMKFIEDSGYTFPVLYDLDSHAAYVYAVYSLPSTYFIDAEGYVIARATGAIDGELLQQGIDMILGEAEQ